MKDVDESELQKMPVNEQGRKRNIFEKYVDDIIRTVKDNPKKLLQEVNYLHPICEFILETVHDKR